MMGRRIVRTQPNAERSGWEHLIINSDGRLVRKKGSFILSQQNDAYQEGEIIAQDMQAEYQAYGLQTPPEPVYSVIGGSDRPGNLWTVVDLKDRYFTLFSERSDSVDDSEEGFDGNTNVYIRGFFTKESLLRTRDQLDKLINSL